MTLKEEVVKIGDKEIKIKEISSEDQFKLVDKQAKGELSVGDRYKMCLENPDIFKELNSEEGLSLTKAINKLNNWDEKKESQSPANTSGT